MQGRTATKPNGKSDAFHLANGAELKRTASKTLQKGKREAKNLYEEGKDKLSELEANFEEYTEQLADSVKRNPITSIVVAAGLGYFISKLLK